MAAFAIALAMSNPSTPAVVPSLEVEARQAYREQPLSFVPNRGQTDPQVRYHAQAPGLDLFLTDRKAVVALTKGKRGAALELRFVGANPHARLEPRAKGASKVNYLTGSVRETAIPTYAQVAYRDLWPGIDMVFRGAAGKLKYEFHVAPGADPSRIRLAYAGSDRLSVTRTGALSIGTAVGTVRDSAPVSYERIAGKRVPVESRFVLSGSTAYGFEVAGRHPDRPLVIDPGLEYSRVLGSAQGNVGDSIAVDGAGNAYVAGNTGLGFPTTPGAWDPTHNGRADAFVTKLDPDGEVGYSTYVGGGQDDYGLGIALGPSGSVYVTGRTESADFPVTAGALDTTYGNNFDGFVTKLAPDGATVEYSTFLGGAAEDKGSDIAADADGNAYVTGLTHSVMFPTTAGAFDPTYNGDKDAFVVKLNPDGSQLVYSTFLGGGGVEEANGIAVSALGTAFVVGRTVPSGFPVTPGAFDTTPNMQDAFVTQLDPAGSELVYSTFLGGAPSGEIAHDVALDTDGNAYVTGVARDGFPITPGAFDTQAGANSVAFAAKLTTNGSSLAYSTFLGNGVAEGHGIAVDAAGRAHVTGVAQTSDFPTTPGAFDTTGAKDAFVTKMNATGAALIYSTLIGGAEDLVDEDVGNGIALGGEGIVYVTGLATSFDFPTTTGPSPRPADAFVVKLDPRPVGYPRPKSAPRVQTSLVPAYLTCASPNRTHGPPLASGSCAPPAQASGVLTLGTPDANGRSARGEGLVLLIPLPGEQATQADEADVRIKVSLEDVYDRQTLTDYVGETELRVALRITDKLNNPGDIGTAADTTVRATVPCVASVDPETGATCEVDTTLDAIVPGAVPEGKRSVWALGAVQVDDGGPDGDAETPGDNTPFLVQGVFVP